MTKLEPLLAFKMDSLTWRGWRIHKPADYWFAVHPDKPDIKAREDQTFADILDRIAEAEGLTGSATDRESELKTSEVWRKWWYGRAEELKQAFRAATGEEYEPGRNYEKEFFDKHFRKGASMFTSFLRFSPKFAAFITAAWLCGNATAVKDWAVAWWNAPTVLELGDWTRVLTCDSCHAAVEEGSSLCPKCGGESFTERKAQALTSSEFEGSGWSDVTRGYVFQDGTTTLEPGHWLVPEREVRS